MPLAPSKKSIDRAGTRLRDWWTAPGTVPTDDEDPDFRGRLVNDAGYRHGIP